MSIMTSDSQWLVARKGEKITKTCLRIEHHATESLPALQLKGKGLAFTLRKRVNFQAFISRKMSLKTMGNSGILIALCGFNIADTPTVCPSKMTYW
jgi:hypothetical protein